ncbi:MAG: Uma2 family endonuclease [Spirochaetaceae bacterium]
MDILCGIGRIIMALPKEYERYSWDEYRSWPEDERWELIEGVAWDMSPAPSRNHQQILVEIVRQFANATWSSDCEVFAAPFDVKLSEEKEDAAPTVVQPDVVLCCDGDKLTEWGMQGPPDLIIEIVSPASGRKDRKQKFSLYERYDVGEYWIVDPEEQVVEIYHNKGKRFDRIGAYGPEDRPGVEALPGFELNLAETFRTER